MQASHDQMVKADKNYDQFYYKEAHTQYIESIEGFMQLLKITQDDANFQAYVKQRLNYLMERVRNLMIEDDFDYRLRDARPI